MLAKTDNQQHVADLAVLIQAVVAVVVSMAQTAARVLLLSSINYKTYL
jgi:hypothetical protein